MVAFSEYLEFLKENKIIEGAIMFFIGAEIQKFMHHIMKDIIVPLTKGDTKRLHINYKEYFVEIIQIVITSYLLFILHKTIKDNL